MISHHQIRLTIVHRSTSSSFHRFPLLDFSGSLPI